MDWIFTLLILIPGIYLAARRSTWLIDYTVLVFVVNRGVRRLVDYYVNQSFNPLSPISLTPLVLTILMASIVCADYQRYPDWMRKILGVFLCVFGFSAIVGFLNVKLASFYALAEVAGPVALMAYAFLRDADAKVKDRWIRSFSWGAIIVSVYGWYQYLTIPPWDAFWLVETKMIGYMGIPEPTQMTVFSTMGERGIVAGYLGYSVVPMVVDKKWRTILGWPAVILVFSVILLTLSRGGIVIAGVSICIYLLVNKGAGLKQALIGAALLGAGAYFGVSMIPNSERITQRYESLKGMNEDGSYQERIDIMDRSAGTVIRSPLGKGLGAGGMGTRVNTGQLATEAQMVDGGYFDILLTYGIPGTIAMIWAMYLAWKQLKEISDRQHAKLAKALMLSLCVSCFAGNFLNTFSVFWLALGTGLSFARMPRATQGDLDRLEYGSGRRRHVRGRRPRISRDGTRSRESIS